MPHVWRQLKFKCFHRCSDVWLPPPKKGNGYDRRCRWSTRSHGIPEADAGYKNAGIRVHIYIYIAGKPADVSRSRVNIDVIWRCNIVWEIALYCDRSIAQRCKYWIQTARTLFHRQCTRDINLIMKDTARLYVCSFHFGLTSANDRKSLKRSMTLWTFLVNYVFTSVNAYLDLCGRITNIIVYFWLRLIVHAPLCIFLFFLDSSCDNSVIPNKMKYNQSTNKWYKWYYQICFSFYGRVGCFDIGGIHLFPWYEELG